MKNYLTVKNWLVRKSRGRELIKEIADDRFGGNRFHVFIAAIIEI